MHAVRASWVGPTSALPRCSDAVTGSKKSRRQSKEDRKALVVTFIKEYQNSNNGDFPSLRLTQKEVGGSFYKVREIVREVIQENRVLGPSKLTPDYQNHDIASEQYPLGSISSEAMFVSAEETLVVLKDGQSIEEDLLTTVNGKSTGPHQQTFDKDQSENGDFADGQCEESDASESSIHVTDEMLYVDSQTTDEVEKNMEIVETSGSKYANGFLVDESVDSQTTDEVEKNMEIVETSSSKYANGFLVDEGCKESDANKSEVHVNHEMLHTDVKSDHKVDKGLDIEEASISKVTPLTTDVIVETFPMKSAAKVTNVKDGRPDVSLGSIRTLEENESKNVEVVSATKKADPLMDRMDVMENESSRSNDEKSAGNHTGPSYPKIAPNGTATLTENINANKLSRTSEGSVSEKELVPETQANIPDGQSVEEGKKSTLNRMKLESWEGAIKKPETNPVLAVFKAFLTSFVKFWME